MSKKQNKRFRRKSKKQQRRKKGLTYEKLELHKLNQLEWVAMALSFWFIFNANIVVFSALIAIPIAGILINGMNRPSIASLVEVDLREDKYDVADFIDFPAFAICFKILFLYSFYDYYHIMIPCLLTFAGTIGVLFLTHRQIGRIKKSKTWIYTSIIFCLFVYSFGFIIGTNTMYDNSVPKKYEVKIIDKYDRKVKRGKKYVIVLDTWGGKVYKNHSFNISKSRYDRLEIGNEVIIEEKEGVYNIPYYYLRGY